MDIPIATFVRPATAESGGGPTIEQLRSMLANHLQEEGKFLQVYSQAIDSQHSPLVKFIFELILADEETHHGVLSRIVAKLDSQLNWKQAPDELPAMGMLKTADRAHLLKLTDAFIAEEKHGIAQCKSLIKSSKGLYRDLLSFLLRTMVHDSEKHLMMLRFIRKQLKTAPISG